MLKPLYGDIMTGRLSRPAYLLFFLLLTGAMVAEAVVIGMSIGLWEPAAETAPTDLWSLMAQELGPIGILLGGAVLIVLLLGQVNIAAKRIRDMGLPPWWMMLTIAVTGVFTHIIGGAQLISGVYLLVLLSLFILPTDSFGKVGGGSNPSG